MAVNPKIYSATYSNVPVYEFNVSPGNHVMRRRADDWINATHILKVAAYDKPARTRILEREVQKGVHEKVQGGYGKYQGQDTPSYTPGSLWLTHSSRHVDPASRRSRIGRTQRRTGQAASHIRFCTWRPQSSACTKTCNRCFKPTPRASSSPTSYTP